MVIIEPHHNQTEGHLIWDSIFTISSRKIIGEALLMFIRFLVKTLSWLLVQHYRCNFVNHRIPIPAKVCWGWTETSRPEISATTLSSFVFYQRKLFFLIFWPDPGLFLFIGSGTSLTSTRGVIIVNSISHMILTICKRRRSLE